MNNYRDITVIAIETRQNILPDLDWIVDKCMIDIRARQGIIVTTTNSTYTSKNNIKISRSAPEIKNTHDYSEFILKCLSDYFTSAHCLIVQHDGYILNPLAWTDSFLDFDYIGAAWPLVPHEYAQHPQRNHNNLIGNGGFSLRSNRLTHLVKRRYYELCTDPNLNRDVFYPEDCFICLNQREYLQSNGCRFADLATANTFSVENNPYNGQLGFHGPRTIAINRAMGIFK